MRDEFEDDHYAADESARRGWRNRFAERVSTWLGAALAVAVIGGMVLWGYRLGQREATAVPVIRAALEQAKIQPEDSGGAEIAHQDIASYNAGEVASAPTEITFAPPPERPAEEDVAMGALQDGGPEITAPADGEPGEADDAAAVDNTDAEPDATADDGTDLAPEASPVAPQRPGDLSQLMETARQAVSEEVELASRAKASPVQIQLGAYSGKELTESEWARIYRENEDILAGRALVVQSTISGGRRFFRLRAGPFKDQIEARNVCRALQQRKLECLVVVNG